MSSENIPLALIPDMKHIFHVARLRTCQCKVQFLKKIFSLSEKVARVAGLRSGDPGISGGESHWQNNITT